MGTSQILVEWSGTTGALANLYWRNARDQGDTFSAWSRALRADELPTLAGLGGVPTNRTISTTAPLTGGGALSGNLTLALTVASSAPPVLSGTASAVGTSTTPARLDHNHGLPSLTSLLLGLGNI